MTDYADRFAITDKLNLYAHAIDRRRWDIMDAVFHDDAEFKFGEVAGDWRSAIAMAQSLIDPMISTHHHLGNMIINVDGDVAQTETYLTATHVIPADYPKDLNFPSRGYRYQIIIAGRYVDRFEKRDGEWRIAVRRGLTDWREDKDVNDGGMFDGGYPGVGQVGDADPSLEATRPWRRA